MTEGGEISQKTEETRVTTCLRYGLEYGLEVEDPPKITDVAIIRPPALVPKEDIDDLSLKLSRRGFLSVILPKDPGELEGSIGSRSFFPTDHFREVGPWIFRGDSPELDNILDFIKNRVRLDQIQNRFVEIPGFFRGGDFIYLEANKVFVYDQDRFFGNAKSIDSQVQKRRLERVKQAENIFQMLRSNGWKIYPVETGEARLDGRRLDLDFKLALFLGKDGKTHAITPISFWPYVPDELETHLVPDEEAPHGACNIADCRRGSVLILPHGDQAPETKKLIKKYAHPKVDVLEAPPRFLERDGGPRCSICSFSV